MDSAESVAAINTMLQLHQDGVFTIRDVDGTADAWAGINDEYAMFFEGPWAPFNEENGIVPALIPTWNGKSASVVGGENIVAFSRSRRPPSSLCSSCSARKCSWSCSRLA